MRALTLRLGVSSMVLLSTTPTPGQVCNLKIVTDASPDYSDLPSLIYTTTSLWSTPEQKCWSLFYWNHIARRQTTPMSLHGLELTDPIRQFNDYGYTMCSTVAGINCALWHQLGLPVKFWDISLHTVSEVFYDGGWHMYDNSMSALYTLCDGRTIAGVQEIGAEGACAVSQGRSERGHVAKYHCLYSTGPDGFLTGADTQRSLDEEARCFNPNGLKYRDYYFNWDYGHRYILNLKQNETYTRYYKRQGGSPEFYVSNNGSDPDDRYQIRGNGIWRFKPSLAAGDFRKQIYYATNIIAVESGLRPETSRQPAEIVFKIQGANVITSQSIKAKLFRASRADEVSMAVSVNNGLRWTEVWKANNTGELMATIKLLEQVNGAYEVLLRVKLDAKNSVTAACLRDLEVETTTMLNSKTQPKLNLGRNTVHIGSGDQTESIVLWPELQQGKYKKDVIEEKNIASAVKHPEYQGTIYPVKARQDAYLVYRLHAPGPIRRLNFGGRFYNRAPQSHIELLYSVDKGVTWNQCWSLQETNLPWDVIHYESVEIPNGNQTVWLKYLMNSSEPSPAGCSIYALRIEANYVPADTEFRPIQVTFNWSERQRDRSLLERSHTQTIIKLPFQYTVNVGGADHPVMNWLGVTQPQVASPANDGYSDGKDVGGEKFVPKWLSHGENLALRKPYTLSVPSTTNWGAGDPEGTKLTCGAGGPSYAGGTSYRSGALWLEHANPIITLDLGAATNCASFGLNFHGYPWWDALKGEVKDRVEVLTSLDGMEYLPQGFLHTDLRWAELPVNFMWPDDETMTSATFRCVPEHPVKARYVQFRIFSERIFDCAGIEVLDWIKYEPFDLRIALPGKGRGEK